MSQQADFYILPGNTLEARERFMSKLLEQVHTRGLDVLILVDNSDEATALDQRLWDYRPDAFLPHHLLGSEPKAAIAISHQLPELPAHEVVINLSSRDQLIPDYPRVVEIVVQEPSVLQLTRKRYQDYKAKGATLNRHDMRRPE